MQIVDIHYKCIFAIEMSRILLLGDINSAHLKKWVQILHEDGQEIGIYSLSKANDLWYKNYNIDLLSDSGFEQDTFHASQSKKLSYLKKRKAVKEAIKRFNPDFLHAHYASSYGLLGALSKFHPFFISVWGSDILLFPSNLINKRIIRNNFKKADRIIVSSRILKEKSSYFTNKDIDIIPFGVDCELFSPATNQKDKNKIVIGTVKSLEKVYGIDILISAFALLKKKLPQLKMKLQIIGSGSEEQNLKALTQTLGLESDIEFIPFIKQIYLPSAYRKFDIAVFLSHSESFGVSILEASACEVPIIATATGGLLEVIEDGITGLHVELSNPEDAAAKILRLIQNKDLREKMGKAGRAKVLREYDLQNNKKAILNLYKKEDTT